MNSHETILGIPVYTDASLVERKLHARSPARAKRRAAKGHRQHYAWVPSEKIILLPNDAGFVCHPSLLQSLKEAIDQTKQKAFNLMYGKGEGF